MLDIATLRVAFGLIALTLFLLFLIVTFRSTRSTYSAWWCGALILFLGGSVAFLLNGTPSQVWANPLGNTLLVAGATSVWAGARSLRKPGLRLWQAAAAPALAAVAGALGHPATDVWAGGAVFLALMSLMIALASCELFLLPRGYSRVQRPMMLASAVLSAYYFCRLVAFVADGPDGRVFLAYFGSAVTTLITMVVLVVVSFSMADLSNEQRTRDLSTRATHDGLTGLLNRSGFLDRAENELRRMERSTIPGSLILADLDHFKAVNDSNGHSAGDAVLRIFAAACLGCVRSTDVVGRYGGEEFILLLPGADSDRAEDVTVDISRRLEAAASSLTARWPTASFGIAPVPTVSANLDEIIASADAALYRAKSLGRNRAEHGLPV